MTACASLLSWRGVFLGLFLGAAGVNGFDMVNSGAQGLSPQCAAGELDLLPSFLPRIWCFLCQNLLYRSYITFRVDRLHDKGLLPRWSITIRTQRSICTACGGGCWQLWASCRPA
jgi:hypothetical protein